MTKENTVRAILSKKVIMTPDGMLADQVTPKQFATQYTSFFESIFEIASSDLTGIEGYGEFNEEGQMVYTTCRDFMLDTFAEEKEGYWYCWKELFETTVLDRAFFEHYFKEMEDRIHYCEGRRYLVYNNAFFVNMVTDGKSTVGFPDWSRSGVCDFLVDFAIMDLNKPYLRIPELLVEYCSHRKIDIPEFKERFLCMAYFKGLDVLRWHASIDDIESCESIMTSIRGLHDRIHAL